MKSYIILLLFLNSAGCTSDTDYVPKRVGYFRIALPERKYTSFNNDNCTFTFEYPQYARVLLTKDSADDVGHGLETRWLNVFFPQFKCNLYLSYMVIDTNLNAYIEECRKFATSHEIKASAITEQEVLNTKEKVYGSIYDIEGNTATNLQFYLTDSTRNFIRGALYFYAVPNKDSIEPALNFVKVDIEHLISTFRWKNPSVIFKLRGGNYPPQINKHED